MTWERITIGLCLIIVLILAGCGKGKLETVAVSGQVRFDGGPCPAPGSIIFIPVKTDEGLPRRPGTAPFKEDGHFTATSYKDGDGLLPGRYLAKVDCWSGMPSDMDPSSYERLNCVPADYKPKEIVVDGASPSVTVEINVPKKKT